MADVHTPEKRSRNMAAIKATNTKPEMFVRRLVHRMGFRFRLHRKDLPGKPDLVFPRLGKIILVHGCFWHLHDCPNGQVKPDQNSDFWQKKRSLNAERDKRNLQTLRRAGWKVLVVWECQLKKKKLNAVEQLLLQFLGGNNDYTTARLQPRIRAT